MNSDEFAERAIGLPFLFGKGNWQACDCWGLVELFYREVFEIDLVERADHGVDASGMQAGFDACTDWVEVEDPQDGDVVLMRFKALPVGHVGIFIGGNVCHATEAAGVVIEPIKSRIIRSRVTGFFRHAANH